MTKKPKPTSFNPAKYTFTVKAHMAADLPWRAFARSETFTCIGDTPEHLWRTLMKGSLAKLGVVDDRMVMGFLLNLCNTMPIKVRETLVLGIMEGIGMVLTPDPENPGQLMGGMSQVFDSLPMGPDGEVRTASGLILPKGTE